ncbi:MAG: GNAT family N-acetyltransferase [Oscillospiraceae bacterium]|nr:GNAT family N-acetyltransferase [Oscillospiraceae bacterium]
MNKIRQATAEDAHRIAEIIVFNYRLNFYPIFKSDEFYFGQMQVKNLAEEYMNENALKNTFVYDDGVIKGVIDIEGKEIKRLFVEPVLQSCGIGKVLLGYAVEKCGATFLWALEKNTRAIEFYTKNGFLKLRERKYEEDTTEYLIKLTI